MYLDIFGSVTCATLASVVSGGIGGEGSWAFPPPLPLSPKTQFVHLAKSQRSVAYPEEGAIGRSPPLPLPPQIKHSFYTRQEASVI